MLVSVIIPSYNSAAYVRDAVESALAQSYPAVEIIVVDDGSTDNTREVLAGYRDRIRYIRQPNHGLSGARNRGLQEAQGELIAFLDADDRWVPEKIARQVEFLNEHPEIGLVHTETWNWDPVLDRCEIPPTDRRAYQGQCYARLFHGNQMCVSSVVVRRSCLETVGHFDREIRRPSTQDYDLWLRIARYVPFGFLAEPLVYYRDHAANASKNAWMMLEDELYVVQKALQQDPELEQIVGSDQVRRRLFSLHFELAYLYFDQGRLREAHVLLAEALRYDRAQFYPWALWFSTLCPLPLVRGARRMKMLAALARRTRSA